MNKIIYAAEQSARSKDRNAYEHDKLFVTFLPTLYFYVTIKPNHQA